MCVFREKDGGCSYCRWKLQIRPSNRAISTIDDRYSIQSGSLRLSASHNRIRLNTRYSDKTQGTGAKSASWVKVFGEIVYSNPNTLTIINWITLIRISLRAC